MSQAARAGTSRGDLLMAVMQDLGALSGLDDHDEEDEMYESLAAGGGDAMHVDEAAGLFADLECGWHQA